MGRPGRKASVLIVARHYPPLVSGGARRPFLLAEGLRALGHEVRIVAPALPKGEAGLAVPHVTATVSEEAAGAAPPRAATPVRDAVRAHAMLPDPDIRWALAACRVTRRSGWPAPDWVITTSPPESVHVAGLILSRQYRARWIADLRDSWFEEPLFAVRQGGLRRAAERPLARVLVSRADLVTAATPAIRDEVKRLGALAALVLPQPGPPPAPPQVSDHGGPLKLLHTGSFSLSHADRDIAPLLGLFAAARTDGLNLRLRLVGRLTEKERSAARLAGAEVAPPVPIGEAWALQREADILVLVAAEGTDAVPGKLAEYAASGRPVLCLGGGAWRADVPGADRPPLALLGELRAPEARSALAKAQARLAVTPEDVARQLVRAMETL